MTQTQQQTNPACECARLRRAIKEYRRWFDTCTHTSAVKWEEQAANAIDELDAALASPAEPAEDPIGPCYGDDLGDDAEDAKPPACDCPARTAISELLKCPDGRSLTWPEIDEICRAALSAPCPTAELRDEIEQHNLWRAEAYRQIAELKALKQEAAEALENAARALDDAGRGMAEGSLEDCREFGAANARIASEVARAAVERLKAEDPR